MKKYLAFLLLCFGFTAYGQTNFNYKRDFAKILARTQDPQDALAYDKLLTRFQAVDTTLTDFEVLALMIGYTDKPEFMPYAYLSTERELYKLNAERKYQEALDKGLEFLKTHPVSLKALFEVYYSYKKLDQLDKGMPYFAQGKRILLAMYFSGDGKSIDEPTFALGPADGQDFIYKFVGADIGTMGSGHDKNGDFIDMLQAKFDDGETLQLYFIIEHAVQKMFSPEDKAKMEAEFKKIVDEETKEEKKKGKKQR